MKFETNDGESNQAYLLNVKEGVLGFHIIKKKIFSVLATSQPNQSDLTLESHVTQAIIHFNDKQHHHQMAYQAESRFYNLGRL